MKLEELRKLFATLPMSHDYGVFHANPQGSGFGIVGPWFPHEDNLAEEKAESWAAYLNAVQGGLPKLIAVAEEAKLAFSGLPEHPYCKHENAHHLRAFGRALTALEAE